MDIEYLTIYNYMPIAKIIVYNEYVKMQTQEKLNGIHFIGNVMYACVTSIRI